MRCLGCMAEYKDEYGMCPNCGYEPGTIAESSLHMQPGSILAGRYLIGKVIGYGGFGVTYIGWDNTLQQRVAIKEYLPSEFATRAVGQTQVTVFGGNKAEQFANGMVKFVEEAKRLAQFQNEPGIVRVFDSFEANNTAYIVMEYLDGETLTTYLEREGKVSAGKAIEMLTPVIRSLETVHKTGIIHRDIAPDNIMLTKDGQVKLIDFGAARYATTSHSRSLTVIIKPGYSPEEQYRSRGDQGPHTDVYALAAVLYRMVTDITPPDALERRAFYENKKKDILVPLSKNCKIEKNKENAILNAMNVRIEDRTKTAGVFLNELTSIAPVKRFVGKIKAIDLMKWPLWAKIVIPVGGITIIALFVLLLTGKISFSNNLIADFTMGSDMTRVPSVINYSVGVAQDKLDAQELTSIISGRETSDTVPANMVLRQGIDAGGVVQKGTSVELYVSAAAEPVVEDGTMPDVAFYSEEEAKAMLTQLGSVVTVEEEYSSDVAAGIVIRASVGYGESLTAGDEVILYISKGPDPATIVDYNEGDEPANPTTTPTEAAVTLNRSSLSLFVGDTVSLAANGGNGSFSWSSSNNNVVSVKNGSVTAVGKGSATITVTSNGKSASCSATVQDNISGSAGPNIDWTFSNGILSLTGFGEMDYFGQAEDQPWWGIRKQVKTVNVASGITSIGLNAFSGCSNVTTVNIADSVSHIGPFAFYDCASLSAISMPNNMTEIREYTFEGCSSLTRIEIPSGVTTIGESSFSGCSNLSVVSIPNGVKSIEGYAFKNCRNLKNISFPTSISSIYGHPFDGAGLENIYYAGSVEQWGTIKIYYGDAIPLSTVIHYSQANESGITLSQYNISDLYIGETFTLSASTFPSGQKVSWTSSNSSVASVNSSGRVSAVSEGSATITASFTYGGQTYSESCSVYVEDVSVWLSDSSLYLSVGDSEYLSFRASPDFGDNSWGSSVEWSSSNNSVATVDSSGRITAVGGGTAIIKVFLQHSTGGKSATCQVTVEAPSIELSDSSISLTVGDSEKLSAYTTPSDADISWSSSDNGVASVSSSGKVTAVGAGTATITAEIRSGSNTYEASCKVTVKAKTPSTVNTEYEEGGYLYKKTEYYNSDGSLNYYQLRQSTSDHQFLYKFSIYTNSGLKSQQVYSYNNGSLARCDCYEWGSLTSYYIYSGYDYTEYDAGGNVLSTGTVQQLFWYWDY